MSDILRDFDKKNEFLDYVAKCGISTSEIMNMRHLSSIFDEIAKDIVDKEDNATAMEFTKCIGELLKKNGVVPKIKKYTKEIVKEHSIEQLYRVSIDELDFTEHDKVFEDKIAELKKDYKTASELLGKYQQENEALKKRIQELDTIDAMRIEEKRELKQRIAELESKEMETVSEIDTSTPIDCANSLINHLTHLEAFLIAPERYEKTFDVDELEQIAEHLLVYCKHNKESE